MNCETKPTGKIVGVLPNGTTQEFDTQEQYEDAYYDMMFELNNEFQIEYPDYA